MNIIIFFFKPSYSRKWAGGSGGLIGVWVSCLIEWEAPTSNSGGKVYAEKLGQTAPLAESLKIILYVLCFCSWEWITFLESPCEDRPAGTFGASNGSIIWGGAFLSAVWTGLKSANHFLILCFLSSLPPFLSLPLKSWGTVIFNCMFKTELSPLFLNLVQWWL